MYPNCFQLYFHDILIYLKRVFNFAIQEWSASIASFIIAISATTFDFIYNKEFFGVNNLLLLIVFSTVIIDAIYGIRVSVLQSKRAYVQAKKYPMGTPERKKFLKKYELLKFHPAKLQFTFFKCFTLLGYLYFANALLESSGEGMVETALDFTVEVLCRGPVAIFWYYEFKSIGKHSEILYGKKAPIFTIIEFIFEPRIARFFNRDKEKENESS